MFIIVRLYVDRGRRIAPDSSFHVCYVIVIAWCCMQVNVMRFTMRLRILEGDEERQMVQNAEKGKDGM